MSDEGEQLYVRRGTQTRTCRSLFQGFESQYRQGKDDWVKIDADYDSRSKDQKIGAANAIWECLDAVEALSKDAIDRDREYLALDYAFTRGEIISVDQVFQLKDRLAIHQKKIQKCYDAAEVLVTVFRTHAKPDDCLDHAFQLRQNCADWCEKAQKTSDRYDNAISTARHQGAQIVGTKLPKVNPRKGRKDDLRKEVRKDLQAQAKMHWYPRTRLGVGSGDWLGFQDLKGGLATVSIWAQADEDGNIVDRVVRKDMPINPMQWFDGQIWAGDPKDLENRVPMEYYLQHKCFEAEDSDAIVQVRAWVQEHEHYIVRIYVAYCPYGDLHHFLSSRVKTKKPFPEPFLWAVFESLALACVVMEQGGSKPRRDWKQIVHRDIKPGNVFLDSACGRYPRYPAIKLADFGLAFETSPLDPMNPKFHNGGAGTRGYKAPEQMRFADLDTGEPVDEFQLLSWTNVWAIGMIMLGIANNKIIGSEDQLSFLPATPLQLQLESEAKKSYSPKLCKLIERCIHWRPEERIQAVELCKEIDDYLMNCNNGMQFYTSDARMGTQEPHRDFDVELPQDAYQLGLARPRVDDSEAETYTNSD